MKRSFTIIATLLFIYPAIGQIVPFQNKKLWGFLDSEGNVAVQPQYSAVGYFDSGYTWVTSDAKVRKSGIPSGGKWGVIDSTGTIVCPLLYEFVDLCTDGTVVVNVGGQIQDTVVVGGKWGLYSLTEKKELIPPIYTAVSQVIAGKGIWVSEANTLNTYIIRTNKDIVDEKNVQISPIFNVDSSQPITSKSSAAQSLQWKFTDYNGNILCGEGYDKVYAMKDGQFIVQKNGKLGRISLDGKTILPTEYTWMSYIKGGHVFWAKTGGKKYLFSEDGHKISEKGYSNTSMFYDSVAFATENGDTYCLINNRGEELTPFTFTTINQFYHGFATVFEGKSKLYIIDMKGNRLLDTNFKTVPTEFGKTVFSDGDKPYSYATRHDNTTVWFDVNGNVIQDSTKVNFGINDVIPDGLWNY